MVKVVAHRGFSGRYPENTEIAFLEAVRLNVDMIEFDLHLSGDKELIVIHDPTVDRTSDGSGSISRMTLAEIRALDAGAWFGERFRGQRFPTFREALDLLASTGIRLNIHVKAYENDRQEVVGLTLAEIERRSLLQQAFIASDRATIQLAKVMQPELQVCNLSKDPLETYIAGSAAIGCRILQPDNYQVDSEFVVRAHEQGMEVNPFYADDEEEMLRLIDCGVDGILTNYPDRLQAVLNP